MKRCGSILALALCAWLLCGCGATKGEAGVKDEDAALRFIPYEALDAQGYGEYRALFDRSGREK